MSSRSFAWNTESTKEIIWRVRAPEAMEYLSKIILDGNTMPSEFEKYIRAFHFHTDTLKRRNALFALLAASGPNAALLKSLAVDQLSGKDIPFSEILKKEVYARLELAQGTMAFLEIVGKYELKDQTEKILNMLYNTEDINFAQNASKTLYQANGFGFIKNLIENAGVKQKVRLLETSVYIESPEVFAYKTDIILSKNQDLEVRKAAIKSFSWGWDGQDYFMKEVIVPGKLPKELEATAANLLLNVDRSNLRKAAAEYLKIDLKTERPLPPISDLSKRKGDPTHGLKVYNKYCIGCHVVNGKGVDFGPGLSEIGSKFGKDGLYLAILMPDAGVSFGYEGWVLKFKSGGGAAGIIVSQTETDVEVKTNGGALNSFKTADILEKKMMDKSLMPSNLYVSMTDDDLVNLVEYLTTLKKSN